MSTEAIAAFKAKLAAQNPLSELASTPVPLATFLTIYSQAEADCYTEYMEGARRLYKYLSPLDYCWDQYPAALSLDFRVPELLLTYPAGELASIIAPKATPTSTDPLVIRAQVIKLIILTTVSIRIQQ